MACHRHEHGVARYSAGHRSRAGPARRQPLGWRPDSYPSALDGERVRGSRLLRDLGARGARFARELGVDVVVGAETAGVPLAASVSLAAGLPFAFVRKPGYRGHEIDEPPVRGADVAGRRVLLVDDAVSSGTAVERFTAALVGEGAEVVGVFVLVDMREVADSVTSVAAALPTESVSTYLQVLTTPWPTASSIPPCTNSASTRSSTAGPRKTRAGNSCPWRHDELALRGVRSSSDGPRVAAIAVELDHRVPQSAGAVGRLIEGSSPAGLAASRRCCADRRRGPASCAQRPRRVVRAPRARRALRSTRAASACRSRRGMDGCPLDDVACHDQSDRGHVQARRVGGVSEPGRDRDHGLPSSSIAAPSRLSATPGSSGICPGTAGARSRPSSQGPTGRTCTRRREAKSRFSTNVRIDRGCLRPQKRIFRLLSKEALVHTLGHFGR